MVWGKKATIFEILQILNHKPLNWQGYPLVTESIKKPGDEKIFSVPDENTQGDKTRSTG